MNQLAACNLVHTAVPKNFSETGHDGQCLPFCPFAFFLPSSSSQPLSPLHQLPFTPLTPSFTLSLRLPRRVQQSCCSVLPAVLSTVARGVCIFQISISRAMLVPSYSSVQGFGTAMPHIVLSCSWGWGCWDAPTLLKPLRAGTSSTLLRAKLPTCFVINSSFLPQWFGKGISLQAGCLQWGALISS